MARHDGVGIEGVDWIDSLSSAEMVKKFSLVTAQIRQRNVRMASAMGLPKEQVDQLAADARATIKRANEIKDE